MFHNQIDSKLHFSFNEKSEGKPQYTTVNTGLKLNIAQITFFRILKRKSVFKKILILFAIIPLFTSAFMLNYSNEAFAEKSLVIKPKSLIYLQDNAYLLIFEGCTGSEPISVDEIKIVSDAETLLLVEYVEGRVIPPQECRFLEVQIQAEDPNSIIIVVESLGISHQIDPDELQKDALSYARADVQMGIPTQISIRTSDLSHSNEPLTDEQIRECENAYNDFVTLTSGEFGARYLYHNFVGDCIMLFEDPLWEIGEEDRYEKLGQRLAEMKQTLKEQEEMLSKPITIRTLSVIETEEQGLYLYTFEGCTGSHSVNVDDAVVASDTEIFSLVSEKREGNVIPPGLCRVLDIKIRADDPDSIRVMIPSMAMENAMGQLMGNGMGEHMKKGPHMSPRAQMKQGVPADEVVCKEGLQLMKKSRDGSAACVSDRAVSKLIERGWGVHF